MRPRFIGDPANWLEDKGIDHGRDLPHHPPTQDRAPTSKDEEPGIVGALLSSGRLGAKDRSLRRLLQLSALPRER